jgi:hypothetical protein
VEISLDRGELLESRVFVRPSRQKARSAKYRSALRWIERHGGLLPALSALDGNFNSLTNTGCLRCRYCREPFVLGLLAWLATLRLVLKALVVKEDLFATRPDEVLPTVNAFD